MNMVYGPCIGMNRLDRWIRASKLGLNPPKEVETILKSDKFRAESLWDGRVQTYYTEFVVGVFLDNTFDNLF